MPPESFVKTKNSRKQRWKCMVFPRSNPLPRDVFLLFCGMCLMKSPVFPPNDSPNQSHVPSPKPPHRSGKKKQNRRPMVPKGEVGRNGEGVANGRILPNFVLTTALVIILSLIGPLDWIWRLEGEKRSL